MVNANLKAKIELQKEAETEHERLNCRSICCLSVGLGKTNVLINRLEKRFIKDKNSKILFATAREIYIENFLSELRKFNHEDWIDKIDTCCIASLKNYEKNIYDFICIDEFHKSSERSYLFIEDQYRNNPDIEILCLTGTPKKFSYPLLPISYSKTIDEAIEENLLNDYSIEIIYHKLEDIHKTINIQTKNTNYSQTEELRYKYLINRYNKNRLTSNRKFPFELVQLKQFFKNLQTKENIANNLILTRLKDKKTLIYAGSIEQATNLDLFAYHSKLSKEDRKTNYTNFFNGDITKLVNVEGLRESVSIPNLTDILLLSPDASESAFAQKLGRNLRLTVDQTANFIVLCAKGTIEEEWLNKAISKLDSSKIIKIYIWRKKEQKELFNKALKYFPIGTKYITASKVDNIEEQIRGKQFEWWINEYYKEGEVLTERSSAGFVYYMGKWAERLKLPDLNKLSLNERNMMTKAEQEKIFKEAIKNFTPGTKFSNDNIKLHCNGIFTIHDNVFERRVFKGCFEIVANHCNEGDFTIIIKWKEYLIE